MISETNERNKAEKAYDRSFGGSRHMAAIYARYAESWSMDIWFYFGTGPVELRANPEDGKGGGGEADDDESMMVSFIATSRATGRQYRVDATGDGTNVSIFVYLLDADGTSTFDAMIYDSQTGYYGPGWQENPYKEVNERFGPQFDVTRIQINFPPRSTDGYNAGELAGHYSHYLIDKFTDKALTDPEMRFDLRAVFFEVLIRNPDGTSEVIYHEFQPPIDPFGLLFPNPGDINESTGVGTPIDVVRDGSSLSIMITFQRTAVK